MSDSTSAPASSPASSPAYPGPALPSPARTLGLVALIGGIALFLVSIAVAVVNGIVAGPYAQVGPSGFNASFSFTDPRPAVQALAISGVLHVVLGTLVGLWVLIQGIVAVATRRGRAAGVIAIVLAALAPGLSLGVYIAVMLANA